LKFDMLEQSVQLVKNFQKVYSRFHFSYIMISSVLSDFYYLMCTYYNIILYFIFPLYTWRTFTQGWEQGSEWYSRFKKKSRIRPLILNILISLCTRTDIINKLNKCLGVFYSDMIPQLNF